MHLYLPTDSTHKNQTGEIASRRGRIVGAALLTAVCVSISSAYGKQNPEGSSTDNSAEVIVTAQKRSERLQDVPVPVSVLNATALTENSQVLLRDYATTVPGLNVNPNAQSATMISIRGITTGDFTGTTVGIMVDDQPYCCSGGWGLIVPDIDPGDLDRIEVLRGPQGTLYGASSMGGLIKYVTVDPSTTAFSGRVEGGTSYVYNGADPGYNLRGSVNVPIGEELAVRISGYNRQDPGYIDNPLLHLDGVNQAEAHGGRLSALWRPSDIFSVKFSATYQNTHGEGTSESVVNEGLQELQQNYIPRAGAYDRRVQVYSAIMNLKLGSVNVTSITGYDSDRYWDSFDATYNYAQSMLPIFGTGGTYFTDWARIRKLSEELRASGSLFGGMFDWLAGGFFTKEGDSAFEAILSEEPTTGDFLGQGYYNLTPGRFREYAGFGDLTWHITRQLDVQIGGRESYTKVNADVASTNGVIFGLTPGITYLSDPAEASANSFTYLLTPSFKVSSDLMLYARLASGYRPGGPNAASAVSQGGTPSFKPDKTENYEVGVKGEFLDRKLSIDASIYHITWKDLQITLETPSLFGYSSNGSAAKSEGVELSVNAKPLDGLSIGAWFSYDNAVLTEAFPSNDSSYGVAGNRLPNSSRFSGNISAEDDFPISGGVSGFVGGVVSFVGDRVGLFTNSAERDQYPGYTKTDLRAGLKGDSWTASLYANNVANVRGLINIVDFFPDEHIYIQPRIIGLNLSKTF